jgi:hypothetical protein
LILGLAAAVLAAGAVLAVGGGRADTAVSLTEPD